MICQADHSLLFSENQCWIRGRVIITVVPIIKIKYHQYIRHHANIIVFDTMYHKRFFEGAKV